MRGFGSVMWWAAATAALIVTCSSASGCGGKPNARVERGERLRGVRFFAYQIQRQHWDDNVDKLARSKYDLLIIDQVRSIKGETGYDSRAEVARLKRTEGLSGRGKIILAYLDIGEAESYRWYWRDTWEVGRPDWIVSEDPDGWDENYPVKFWDPSWKKIVKESVKRIIADGYDGMYLDWLEVYSFEPVAEAARDSGREPRRELNRFVAEIAWYARARDPNFIIVAQNAAEMGRDPAYLKLFDAVAQEAVWFDGGGDPDDEEVTGDVRVKRELSREYLDYLEVWQAGGRPVFNVEYAKDRKNAALAYKRGREKGFVTYVTLRPLASLSKTPPPGYEQ